MKTELKIAIVFWPLIVPAVLINWLDWLGLVGRFMSYCMTAGIIISTSIAIALAGPRKYKFKISDWFGPSSQYHPAGYDKSKYNVVLDTHFHTRYSDGAMTVEEGIAWHIAMGFNAFFVTDHDTLANADDIRRLKEKYKDKILVMQGVEISTKRGDVNVLGLHEWDFDKLKSLDADEKVQCIVEEAHKQHAVVSINHFPWSTGGTKPRWKPGTHLTREKALQLGFDLMEVSNWDDDIATIDDVSIEFCKQHPDIAPVAVTDVHQPDKDRLCGWTLLHVDEFTEEAVMAELRAKRTDVLLVPGGVAYPTKHKENPAYTVVKPLAQLGTTFISLHQGGAIGNLDKKGVVMWFIYLVLLFVIIEGLAMLR
nr:CehA/McbA family metallohydrolase [Candidatus Sigynarchaeota archaeon]